MINAYFDALALRMGIVALIFFCGFGNATTGEGECVQISILFMPFNYSSPVSISEADIRRYYVQNSGNVNGVTIRDVGNLEKAQEFIRKSNSIEGGVSDSEIVDTRIIFDFHFSLSEPVTLVVGPGTEDGLHARYLTSPPTKPSAEDMRYLLKLLPYYEQARITKIISEWQERAAKQ